MGEIHKQRLQAVAKEMRRLRRAMAWVLSASAGLVSLLFAQFGWQVSAIAGVAFIVLGLLVLQSIIIWRLAKHDSGEWFDREYILLRNAWIYSMALDNTALDGECVGERRLVCKKGTISSITIEIAPKENLLPRNPDWPHDVSLINYTRARGTISIRDPHRKEGASFAFQIDFNPPLFEGEEIYLMYRFKIPRLKFASYEELVDKASAAKLGIRDYEYNSFRIAFPTKRFEYEILFLAECLIKPKAIEVRRGTDIFREEQDIVLNNRCFECTETLGAWRMTLNRNNPPLRTTYRLMWYPPRLSAFGKSS